MLWPFGIFSVNLVYFVQFWYALPIKIWQPFQLRIVTTNVFIAIVALLVRLALSVALLFAKHLSGEKRVRTILLGWGEKDPFRKTRNEQNN
jgi:hypothetical protein